VSFTSAAGAWARACISWPFRISSGTGGMCSAAKAQKPSVIGRASCPSCLQHLQGASAGLLCPRLSTRFRCNCQCWMCVPCTFLLFVVQSPQPGLIYRCVWTSCTLTLCVMQLSVVAVQIKISDC
jgi:hypothetical protein